MSKHIANSGGVIITIQHDPLLDRPIASNTIADAYGNIISCTFNRAFIAMRSYERGNNSWRGMHYFASMYSCTIEDMKKEMLHVERYLNEYGD